MKKNTDDGARIYTPLTLKLYDWWVLGVSNRLAWGCPTKEHLLPHFLEHLGNNHLDIGVGTGFYLTHVPESSLISLMDLNEASLNAASTRAGESKIKHKISHDVFEPYPAALHGQFDSISMFYLLHCLPGNISTKSCVIRNAAQALTDDGTLAQLFRKTFTPYPFNILFKRRGQRHRHRDFHHINGVTVFPGHTLHNMPPAVFQLLNKRAGNTTVTGHYPAAYRDRRESCRTGG
ncbi:hypothetical protein ESCOMM214M_04085 [Escherichia coli]